MDRATVIVAIPAVTERVNKVSSEAVAHMTLLYLGDVDLSEGAVLYVQHACEQLSPFGVTTDYRGTLGEDDADVLFFENNAWDLKRVREFRHHLLLNDEIKAAYDAADQYPEWTPHLTLGYPEAPARDGEDDYLGYISFDRIAVWTGDFEGPEFRLKYDDHAMEVAMSDMTTVQRGAAAVDEMFHYGVKGMKWGVRKSEGRGKIRRAMTKADVATDAGAKVIDDGEKKLIFLPEKNRRDAALKTQTRVLAEAVAVNRSPQFKGKDLKGNEPLRKEYFKQVEKRARDIYAEELGIARTEAWADFLGVDSRPATNQMRITALSNRIQHAEDDIEVLLELNFETDDLGHIIKVDVPEKYLAHSEDIELELFHYGVKGMRWGVRRDRATSAGGADKGPTAVVVEQKKPGTYAKSKGGENLPMSDDARAALEGRQKARASTTDALSNAELRKVVERMNLEQQYQNLAFQSDRRSKGQRFIQGLFGMKRYGGKEKRRFTDSSEESGAKIREAIDAVLEARKPPAD